MKTKTIFKKSRIIVAAIVLAVLIALVAVVAVLAADEAKFAGVRVTTSGKVNMEFYYTITDANAGVTRAKVEISDGEWNYEPYFVDLTDEKDGNRKIATVRLDAAEMGYTVTVTPYTENGEGQPACPAQTWSMSKYAAIVLGSDAYATDHAPLKAILNYGSYAKDYFESKGVAFDTTVADVNQGIYSRYTNPITGIASKVPAGAEPKATTQNDELVPQDSIEFSILLNDTIELRMYYEYRGEGVPSGRYDAEKGKWYTNMTYIDTEHFGTDYSVQLSADVNGSQIVTVENATVLNFISTKLVNDAETRDLALAMYYYYYWTNNDNLATIDQTTCGHVTHFENAGTEGISVPVCTLCAKSFDDVKVADNINYFSAPGQIVNNWATSNGASLGGGCNQSNSFYNNREYLTDIITDEHGTYTRVHLYNGGSVYLSNGTTFVGENQEGTANNLIASGENGGGLVVLKIRSVNNDMLRLGLLADNGADISWDGHVRVSEEITSGTDESGFVVYVIDWREKFAVDINAVCAKIGGYTGTAEAGARVDIAYFAICDDWDEVAEITAGETNIVKTTWTNAVIGGVAYTSTDLAINPDGTCAAGCVIGNKNITVDGNKVSYLCDVCAVKEMATATRPTVGAGEGEINFYSAAGQQWNNWATADSQGAEAHGNVSVPAGTIVVDENGNVLYNRIYLGTSATFKFYGENSSEVGLGWAEPQEKVYGGSGRYAVMKVRGTNTNLQFGAYDGVVDYPSDIGGDDILSMNRVYYVKSSDGWYIQIIDLEKYAADKQYNTKYKYFTPSEALETVAMVLRANTNKTDRSQYLDVQYFALCDDWNEIATVVGEDSLVTYTSWYTWSHDAFVYGDGTCPDHRNAKLQSVEGNVYNYKCSAPNCNGYTFSVTVPEKDLTGINFYSAPGQQGQSYNCFSNSSKKDVGVLHVEDGVVFNRIYPNESAAFVFTDASLDGREGMTNVVDTIDGSGNYIVMKIRLGSSLNTNVRLGLYDGTTNKNNVTVSHDNILDHRATHSNTGRTDLTAMKNGWVVYVIDIAKMNPNFYTAGNAELTKASFGFKINNGDGREENDYVDVAYFAVCDDWAEIKQVVGDTDSVTYTAWNTTAGEVTYVNEHANASECKLVLRGSTTDVSGNVTYHYGCSSPLCHNIDATKTIPASVNYFSAAGQQLNHWACTPVNGGGSKGWADNVALNNLNNVDGEIYNRIYTNQGAQMYFSDGSGRVDGTKAPEELLKGGSGRYIVVRMRADKQTYVQFQMNVDSTTTGWWPARYNAAINTDEFITYIIDRGSALSTTATKIYAGMAFDTGATAQKGAYIDIAYYALVDNWTEINALIGDENAVYCGDWGNEALDKELDCANNKHGEVVKSVQGNVYKIVCQACGKAITNVDTTNLNLFMAPGKWENKTTWGSKTDGKILEQNGIAYTRFYELGGPSGATAESTRLNGAVCLSAANNDDYSYTNLNGGSGNYVAIKMRVSKVDSFKVAIGTGGASGLDCNGTALNMKPYDNEWVVVVIDLSAAKSAQIGYHGSITLGADVASISVNLVPSAAYPGHYMDFAYMAVCDDWAELETVICSDRFVLTNVANFSTAPVYDFSGKHLDEHTEYTLTSSTATLNTYTCAGKCYDAKTGTFVACTETMTMAKPAVGADSVNWFSAPSQQFALSYGDVPAVGTGTKFGNVFYDQKNDVLYTHINLRSGSTFEILNGSAEPVQGTNTQTTYGVGRYVVLKMRTNSPEGGLNMGFVTGTWASWINDVGNNTRTKFADGWGVYVIDTALLDACGQYSAVNASISKALYTMRYKGTTSVDIAYFATCDNWAEVATVVGDDEVILTSWNFNGGKDYVLNSEGKKVYTYENNVESRPISDYVNYWIIPNSTVGTIGKNLWDAGGYTSQEAKVGVFMTEGEESFSRVTLWNGGSFELAHRADQNHESKGRSSMDCNLIGGIGKYMVIRVRMGTTEGSLGILARNDGGDGERYITRSGLEGDATTGFYQQFHTFVIDLSQFESIAVTGDTGHYNTDGNNAKATFAFKGDSTGGTKASDAIATDYVDVAYFAICDNWTEVQEVVGTETEVIYSSSWSNKSADVTYSADKLAELVAAEKAN